MRPTGPGKYEIYSAGGSQVAIHAKIYNFDIDGWELKTEHRFFLRNHVLQILERGGSLSLIGLASRTAEREHNRQLSSQRAGATRSWLQGESRRSFNVRSLEARGEDLAEQHGQPDRTEDEHYRAVILAAWRRTDPPPISPNPPVRDPAPAVVRRVLERRFLRVEGEPAVADQGREDAPSLPEAVTEAAGELIGLPLENTVDALRWANSEQRPSRVYTEVPVHFLVNRVTIITHHSQRIDRGTLIIMNRTVRYEWGRPLGNILVEESNFYRWQGRPMPPTRNVQIVSREDARGRFFSPVNPPRSER